jgi:hypothetical protein
VATRAFTLKGSLREWQRKLSGREKLLEAARRRAHANEPVTHEEADLIHKREAQVAEAKRWIATRKKQIAAQKPLRLRAYDQAEALIGVMEQGGNNRGPMVSKIITANGGVVGEPWCGDTMAYVYRAAGSKAVTRAWASVYFLGRLAGIKTVKNPERGDLVRYKFDHVGMFDRWVDRPRGIFLAIEGNTGASGAVSDSTTGGDGVYRKQRNVSQVENFRRVTR